MKKIFAILTLVFLFSCKKENVNPVPVLCTSTITDAGEKRPVKPPTNVTDTTVNIPIDGTVSVIYLDFDGQYVSSPYWNNGVTFYCKPSGLTSTDILNVTNTVKNYYGKYRVVVTTDSTQYYLTTHRQRVIITATSFFGNSTGQSYIGSMFYPNETPDFVFSANLYYNSFYVGQLCAHEAGHTVGLQHQSVYSNCQLINEYNPGKIMGNSLNTSGGGIWFTGPTPLGCTNIQNDDQVLTNKLGLK